MITIKNSKDNICDYKIPYIDVDISEKCESIKKIVDEIRQKFIDITGIPKKYMNQNNYGNSQK